MHPIWLGSIVAIVALPSRCIPKGIEMGHHRQLGVIIQLPPTSGLNRHSSQSQGSCTQQGSRKPPSCSDDLVTDRNDSMSHFALVCRTGIAPSSPHRSMIRHVLIPSERIYPFAQIIIRPKLWNAKYKCAHRKRLSASGWPMRSDGDISFASPFEFFGRPAWKCKNDDQIKSVLSGILISFNTIDAKSNSLESAWKDVSGGVS